MDMQDLIDELPELRRRLLLTARGRVGPALAEDLVQDVLTALVEQVERIDRPRLLRYAYGILRFQLIHSLRRVQARPEDPLVNERTGEVLEIPVPATQELTIEGARARAAILALPDNRRALAVDVIVNGVCYADAARKYGIPIGTVRSRVSRITAELRGELTSPRRPAWPRAA